MGVHNTDAYFAIKHLLDIPLDEPIFILRGQDRVACYVIERYADLALRQGANSEFVRGVESCITDFEQFAMEHSDRMKVPD